MKKLYRRLVPPQLRTTTLFKEVEPLFLDHTESPRPTSLDDVFAVESWECRLLDSLADLSEILFTCYGRPCVILLDEFDVPFMQAELACKCTPAEKDPFADPTCECAKSADLLSSMLKQALKVIHSSGSRNDYLSICMYRTIPPSATL